MNIEKKSVRQPLLGGLNMFGAAHVEEEEKNEEGLSLLQKIDTILNVNLFRIQLYEAIYEVVSSCYYHSGMSYCPVLLKISSVEIQKNYGANYLLQVWKEGGKKIYEKRLHGEVKLWTVSYGYFIFKPSNEDIDSDYLHIVDLKDKNAVYKVKDFVQDPSYKFITYANKKLYIANDHTIKCVDVVLGDDHKGQQQEPQSVISIPINPEISKVHGLFMTNYERKIRNKETKEIKVEKDRQVIVALQTEDDQIDFNILKFKKATSINDGSNASYILKQYREIIPRKNFEKRDPIVSFHTIIKAIKKENIMVSVAKRQSGEFDLYYSGSKVFSSTPGDVTVKSIDLTFDNIYMQMHSDYFTHKEVKKRIGVKEEEGEEKQEVQNDDERPTLHEVDYKLGKKLVTKPRIRKLDLKWETDINYDHSEVQAPLDLSTLFQWRLQKHFLIFNSFCLVGTALALAHGNIISLFNVLVNQWKHFFFEHVIVQIFRDGPAAVVALFSDDSICVIEQKKIANTGEDQEPWEENKSLSTRLPEKLIDYHQDREDSKWIIFVTKRSKKQYGVYTLYNHQLYDITDQFINGFTDKPNMVFLFSVNEETEFIAQHGTTIDLFTIEAEEETNDDKEEEQNIADERDKDEKDEEKKDDDEDKGEGETQIEKPEEKKVVTIRPKVTSIMSIDISEQSKKEKKLKSQIKNRVMDGVKFQQREEKAGSKPKFFLFLSDATNFYTIDLQTQAVKRFANQHCMGLYFSDNNYLYTISQKGENRAEGLRLYDIENVIVQNKDYSYLLTDTIQVTCQGQIDFSKENERITFLASYEKIGVTPLIHRNTMSFMGMKKRENYIATRVIKGKFIALSNKGKLYAWDLITGKLILGNKANVYKQYKDYDIYCWMDVDEDCEDLVYSKEWFSKILLIKKTPLPDQEKYAETNLGYVRKVDNQVLYNEKTEKVYFEFKVIEITSETDVKEHLSFVHAVLPGCMQYMYFSDDLKYMYERQKYEKNYIYERIDSQAPKIWSEYHRFDQIPVDLLDITQYPYIFTPNFTRYLDVDETGKLIVRNTFKTKDYEKEEQIYKVPKQLANGKLNKIEEIMRRIRWINEDMLHIINDEGIERVVDVTKKFKEIEFNFIPLYDSTICQKQHYILDFPSYRLNECFPTLRARYQSYKSSQYLKRAIDSNYDLYEDIFHVDYRIDNCYGQFETDMSFSFLHWSMIEQLRNGKLQVEQIDEGQIKLLFYNILPKGDTVLHKLHMKGNIIEKLLQIAHPNAEDRSQVKIHIPIIKNMKEKSSIHLHEDGKEYRYINVLLEYLSAYPIDHHSRAIKEVLPCMIEKGLPNFIPYLQSRIKQTQAAALHTKGMLNESNENGICATSLWLSKDALDSLFQEAPIEQDVKLQFIDIPEIHQFTSETGMNFFKELASSEDMKLFETTAVKKFIEFQWPLVLKFTIRRLLIPFIAFQIFYMVYMHAIFGNDVNSVFEYTTIVLLLVAALYLIGNEATQLYKQSYEYFLSIWNYFDIIPPTMIVVFIALDQGGAFENGGWMELKVFMQAIMSLFIWLKFLYFLRIFESTGYLIRIIIQVVIDMRHFLLLLLLTFIAFGHAIYNINAANTVEEEKLYEGDSFLYGVLFVYRMVLGDFDTTAFGSVAVPLMWTLFILCTVMNMIIMLNLLIAIISESFANINSVSQQASYQEKASIISENLYLIPDYARKSYCSENSYILLAIDTQLESENQQESIDAKLKFQRRKIRDHTEKLFDKLNKRIKKLSDSMAKLAGLPAAGTFSQMGQSVYGGHGPARGTTITF